MSDRHLRKLLDEPRIGVLVHIDQGGQKPGNLQDLVRDLRSLVVLRVGRSGVGCRCCRGLTIGLERCTFCLDIEPFSPIVCQFGTKIPGVQSLAMSVTEMSDDAEEVLFQCLAFGVPLGVCLFHGGDIAELDS